MAKNGLSDRAIRTVTRLTSPQIWYWSRVYNVRRREYRDGLTAKAKRLCRMLAATRELRVRVDNLILLARSNQQLRRLRAA